MSAREARGSAAGGDVTPAVVASLVARHRPELAGAAVAPLGEGDFCHAFLLDDAWVVRVAKHAGAAASLRREACLLPRLAAQLPLRVPQPVLTVAADGANPAFAIHAMLSGPALTRERWEALAPGQRDGCARQLGRFLVALHAVDASAARACGVPALDPDARRAELREKARAGLPSRLTVAERRLVDDVLREGAASADRPAPVLLHGDLSPDHVLFDDATGEVTGVIDFGDLAIGDPAWDLVYVYEDYGLDFLGRLLTAYPMSDRGAVLARMQRLLELDAVQWIVRCAAALDTADDGEALADALAYLGELREQSHAPPWRALL